MVLPLVNLLAISLFYLGVIKVKHVHCKIHLIDQRSLYVLEWLSLYLWFLFKTMCYVSKTMKVSLDCLDYSVYKMYNHSLQKSSNM